MAILQSQLNEIRYLKRQNLDEEAKLIGNMYRDIIRQYGIDCNYYKIKIPHLEYFKNIIDENALLINSYGEDSQPDYSISTIMLTYMEVENDIFQLNKYGVIPNMDVNFYFDSTDFACSLAYKLGQLKEYPIKEQEFEIEVPKVISDYVEYDHDNDGRIIISSLITQSTELSDYHSDGFYTSSWIRLSAFDAITHEFLESNDYDIDDPYLNNIVQERMYLSDDIFPYGIGYNVPEFYECEILTGKFAVKINPYEIGKEYTVMCKPYEHNNISIRFPSNDTIYKSFEHVVDTKEFIDQVLFLKYKVSEIVDNNEIKYILNGKLYGSILFHDLTKVGKYMDKIHPDVGDIVTIDFPDENNRQQFEITDCYDKNLTNDGINPLLHKYIWKCKARRYINSGEVFPEQNEANERWSEQIDFNNTIDEQIGKEIGKYDDKHDDDVYGGYDRKDSGYDKQKINNTSSDNCIFIDDGTYINIFTFHDKSSLKTDGYELYFITSDNICYKISYVEDKKIDYNLIKNGLQYLKATDNALYFVNFDDSVQRICEDDSITNGEIELCLNSLIDSTYSTGSQNSEGDFYYKFIECNTVLMSLNGHLYCRFGNKERKMVKIC